MSELNEPQTRIADAHEGMIVVDAGPGTGKTHTIVERYVRMISKPNVSPRDVLLMTFTNNAASEMEERIKRRMTDLRMERDSKLVMTKTFDAFCLSIVLDSPDLVSEFFGISERLTRAATMQQNESLKRDYFLRFMDSFLNLRGSDYGSVAIIASEDPLSVMSLINNLMSRGIVPLKKGWFGNKWEEALEGDTGFILQKLRSNNNVVGNKCPNWSVLEKLDENSCCGLPVRLDNEPLPEEILPVCAEEPREDLFRFVHDVYYEYIRQSITDNRLTFNLVAIMALTLLYSKQSVRERNSFRYLMVDEFQDTNANQLMISLMILAEPNLCVVGDWKQGIYGFRYVSIENITRFEEKAVEYRRFLNEDGVKRVGFSIPEVKKLPLDLNYRSSQLIIDKAFDCIFLKGSNEEEINEESLQKDVVRITAKREDIGDDTYVRFVQSDSKESEVEDTIRAIRDYVNSGRYVVKGGDDSHPVGYGDIAVICRKTEHCRMVRDACEAHGIPAYLQGDVQIMSTREGKLALAWLRYVNNDRDPWAFVPIMADMDYTPIQIQDAYKDASKIPKILVEQRERLYRKRRRITDLLTSLFQFYRLDNDITQAIITTISSVHRNSLLTISDVIRIISDDIENKSTYTVENFVDDKAVTIMTMHKSKGLEFPVVIVPFMDRGTMPGSSHSSPTFSYENKLGIRCYKEIGYFGDYSKICLNWKAKLAASALDADYSEERRLMFVALSRAKQYETIICGPNPSKFIDGLRSGDFETIPEVGSDLHQKTQEFITMPKVPDYPVRRVKLGVHDILDFSQSEDGISVPEGSDEVSGKGMEYGEEVHRIAERMCHGRPVDESYPEVAEIRKVLDSVKDADILYAEMECGLPLEGKDITLRGVIDLLALFEDHVEIHDYKTDVSDRFEQEYIIQLSVYAYAAQGFFKKPVRCFIDYVSRGITKEIASVPLETIIARAEESMQSINSK